MHNKPELGLTLRSSPQVAFRTAHRAQATGFKGIITHIHTLLAALQLLAFDPDPHLLLAL